MRTLAPHRGFSLLEVLVGLAILAAGVLAIATIFPVASRMQKFALETITADQVADAATQIVQAAGVSLAEVDALTDPTGTNTDVIHVSSAVAGGGYGINLPATPATFITPQRVPPPATEPENHELRGARLVFPMGLTQNINDTPMFPGPTNVRFFVEMLVRSTDGSPSADASEFDIILCVLAYNHDLHSEDPFNYFMVRTAVTIGSADDSFIIAPITAGPYNDVANDGEFDLIRVGDHILDEFGSTYRVQFVETSGVNSVLYIDGKVGRSENTGNLPVFIWHAMPSGIGQPNPLKRVITLDGDEVLR